MRHPLARADGRGHLSRRSTEEHRWLLIGNSRWHWAAAGPAGWRGWSEPAPARLDGQPLAWAAAGVVPAELGLDPARQLLLADVPLAAAPPWLGVDRALAGWQARRCSGHAVLVADAGTALSLTRVNGSAAFAGGRLLAGARLQLQALGSGTAALPQLAGGASPALPQDPWPRRTAEAMEAGVLRGLAAAVEQAWREAQAEEPGCRLWLTGGDGPALAPLLGVPPAPLLALEGLAALRPA